MMHKDKQDKWFHDDSVNTTRTNGLPIYDGATPPKTLADYERLMEMEENKRNGATPHKCPICVGRGFVQGGFYGANPESFTSGETCRACGGRGIIWG